jgi:hypothetical protein
MTGPQPIEKDRQPNARVPVRAELHRLQARARVLALRVEERAATLADVDELAEIVLVITGGPP